MRYNVTIARKAVQPRSSGTAQQTWNRKNGWFPGAYPKGPAAAGYALLAEQWLAYRFEKERVLLCR